jgi:hypothetical protein
MPSAFLVIISIIFLVISLYSLFYEKKRGWGGKHPEIDKLFIYTLIVITPGVIIWAIIGFILSTVVD